MALLQTTAYGALLAVSHDETFSNSPNARGRKPNESFESEFSKIFHLVFLPSGVWCVSNKIATQKWTL
jgi:hypothetical protein